ncbi:MAG TPA: hypothetical protein VMV33_17070 [Rhodocyclaceae bacterium]|nr:hypothetical protein [Rhodocyclaceae bacterium]
MSGSFNPFAALGAVAAGSSGAGAPSAGSGGDLLAVNLPQMPAAPRWSPSLVPTMSAEDAAAPGRAPPDVPTALPGGGGVLPSGAVTTNPQTWQRWLSEYQPPGPAGASPGPGAGTAPAGQSMPSLPPTPAAAGPATAGATFNPFTALGATPADAGGPVVNSAPASGSVAGGAQAVPVAPGPATVPAAASAPVAPGAGAAGADGKGKRSGYLANIAAGGNEAVAGLLGMPVDALTGILNLSPRAINAVTGAGLPLIEHPVGGTESLHKLFGLVGANPEDVVPATPGEGLARAGARGAVGVALPGGIARRLASEGITGASSVGDAVLHGMGQGAGPSGVVAGTVGGVTGHAAAEASPEALKPTADMLGNIVGGGAVALGQAAVGAGARTAAGMVGRMREPLPMGKQPMMVDPETGVPFLDEHGAPIRATAGQQQMAGRRIAEAAGMKPGELAAAIPSPADSTLVPGSQGTLGQVMNNLRLMVFERQLRAVNRTPFTASEAENQVKRLTALRGLADPEAAGAAAGEFFAEKLAKVRAAADALADAERVVAQQKTARMAGGGVQEDQVGEAQRIALDALRKPIKDAAGALFDAVDPSGKLALNVRGVRQAARRILDDVDPTFGDELGPEEKVLRAAAGMAEVVLFKNLRKMDSNLSRVQRQLRMAGEAESPAYRRASILRNAIDEAMTAEVNEQGVKGAQAAVGQADGSAFHAWFNGSKVVDEAGQPLRVFHGTADPTMEFAGNRDAYFSTDPAIAQMYAETGMPTAGTREIAPFIRPAYVSIKNPKVFGPDWTGDVPGTDVLRRQGFDGMILEAPNGQRVVVAFHADQVRPAIGTVGDRLAQAGSVGAEDAAGGAVPKPAPQVGSQVFTPSGRAVDVRYGVREASDLVTSHHHQDMATNPKFPAELQPRARERAASEAQVASIAGNIQPERLGASASAEGTPIIGPDGIVESGNGRVMALRRAYEANNAGSKAYRKYLEDQGYDVAGVKEPVLVRERQTPMDMPERVRFAEDMNAGAGLSMSASERAAVDAKRISDDLMRSYVAGDVTSAANRDFVRKFADEVLDKGEHGSFATGEAELSKEGAQRVRNALLAKAYDDPNLIAALTEVDDANVRAFGAALSDAAGPMARLQVEIKAGEVDPGMAISKALVEAARMVSDARRRGISLADSAAQRDVFQEINPTAERILQAAYGVDLRGRLSRGRLADMLDFYSQEALKQGTQDRLFGANLTQSELLKSAEGRVGQRAAAGGGSGEAVGAGGAVGGADAGAGPRVGAGGPEAQRPGAGAGGEASAGRPAAGGDRRILPQAKLEPNFAAEDRDALREANRAYQAYKATWRKGTVGQVLMSGSRDNGFRMADSAVPATLFRAGKRGAEAAKDLIKAVGSPEAAQKMLGDYPAFSFRQAAERNGIIDPARGEAWLRRHKAVLDQFPELRSEFRSVISATRAVDEAAARGTAMVKEMQDSAARHFLTRGGDAVDPKAAIGRLMASPTAVKDARALMAAASKNRAAVDGIKRNLVDYIMARTRSTAEAGTTGEKEIAGAIFQRMAADPRQMGVIRTVLGDKHGDMIVAMAKDIERFSRAISATRIPGSPGTAADMHLLQEAGQGSPSVVGQVLIGDAAGRILGAATNVSGFTGAALRGTAIVSKVVLDAMKHAGLKTVDDLMTQAVLQPELARLLASRVKLREDSPVLRRLLGQLALVGANAAATGSLPVH